MNTAAKFLLFSTVTALAVVTAQAQKSKMHTEIDPAKLPPPATQNGVTFDKDIRPLLEATCVRCHGQDKQKGGLRLDSLEAVLKGGDDGKVVIPGDSAKSLLVIGASRLNEEFEMPPNRRQVRRLGDPAAPGSGNGTGGLGAPSKPLTAEQVGLLRAWIEQGAK